MCPSSVLGPMISLCESIFLIITAHCEHNSDKQTVLHPATARARVMT